MKGILVIGAGKSAFALIRYLLDQGKEKDWYVTVGDKDEAQAKKSIGDHPGGVGKALDVTDPGARREAIGKHDLIISMLPAHMHIEVVKDCIEQQKDVITPSYVSDEILELKEEIREAGILVLNELGVDPGIDHMSAMKVLDKLRSQGYDILRFESFTGGLVAPSSDDNPWGYKFTWNPRNVVLAAQGGPVKFKQQGKYKYIPPHQVFRRIEHLYVDGYGRFEGYPNRDSLKYRSVYGLEEVPTIFRGTLRRPGFCRAWNALVQLGVTDDRFVIEGSQDMTYRAFVNSFLAYHPTDSVELKLMHYLGLEQESEVMDRLKWLGLFEDRPIELREATPARILQQLLEEKWALKPEDRDMIVMYHRFGFWSKKEGERQIDSFMVYEGEGRSTTAMADAVGLPLGIASKSILTGDIRLTGVRTPIEREIYEPLLRELKEFGLEFQEKEVDPIRD